jgi:low affinity Fe/Cu permease
MRTLLKVLLIMQTFGWIPLLILIGRHISPINSQWETLLLITSVSILAISLFLFTMLFFQDTFWKTIKQLESKIEEYQKATANVNKEHDLYVRACVKLANKLLELDREKKS